MSELDDALNSSAPLYAPSDIYVDWAELPPNVTHNLSSQIGDQGYVVEQSMDDGLPDPVTMTSSNDASGKFATDLVGRPPVIADSIGWRTDSTSGSGTGTTIDPALPDSVAALDWCIMCISVNSNVVALTDLDATELNLNGWQLLGSYDDGATLKSYVYAKQHYPNATDPHFSLSASASYSWTITAAYAQTVNGIQVAFKPTAYGAVESTTTTTHTAPAVTLARRGMVMGFFASLSASASWTPGAGTTELIEIAAVVDVMVSTTPLAYPLTGYTLTGVTSAGTGVATMVAVTMEVLDLEPMDASTYFSPFNKDSPVYGWDRDTADVGVDFNVSTESGVVPTTIFTGLMEDIPVKGRTAEMQAVSKTRIRFSASVNLPAVWAFNEGLNTDWLATWLMARGGQFIGPAPSPWCLFWAPMYGSIHPHLEGVNTYAARYYYTSATGTVFQVKGYPTTVTGPFGARAMYGAQNNSEIHRVTILIQPSKELLPHQIEAGGAIYDQMSMSNTAGRIAVWLRGDPVVDAPAFLGGDTSLNMVFKYRMTYLNSAGTVVSDIICTVDADTRKLRIVIGGIGSGYSNVISSSPALPTDGAWHFCSWSWDRIAGTCRMKMDSGAGLFSSLATPPQQLPATDAAGALAGGYFNQNVYSHVPISDFHLEAGPTVNDGLWTPYWPTPAAPSQNAAFREWSYAMHALVEPAPVDIWTTLAELAASTITSYRCQEDDTFAWMPLVFFGQTEQMTPQVIMDTEVNAGELDVTVDASKVRNVVTMQFPETRVDSVRSIVYTSMTSMVLPVGKTTLTVALDVLCAAVHGAGIASIWNLSLLTPTQISTKVLPDTHYISVNTKEDGSGTQITSSFDLNAKIISGGPGEVTLEFYNRRRTTLYMTNNGDQVPYLCLYGYGVRTSDGYVTARNTDTRLARRERALTFEAKWIQNRVEATQITNLLLSILSVPRPEVKVTVMGDPRRTPGQLVTIKDSENTKAAGNWRILSVTSKMAGAQFVQDLELVGVGPVAVWDDPSTTWDYSVWGE